VRTHLGNPDVFTPSTIGVETSNFPTCLRQLIIVFTEDSPTQTGDKR